MFRKRIDELGRIVIPKELRNNLKMNDFDELELCLENNSIVIKKTIGIELYKEKLDNLLYLLKKFISFDILITDKNKIICSTYNDLFYDELISLKQNTFNPKEIVKCNYNLVKSKNIDKYINIQSIIVDSNLLGYFIILKDDKDIDMDLINNIKKVINDIVN